MTAIDSNDRHFSIKVPLLCIATYLSFTLQQVVVLNWQGAAISLGTAAIGLFVSVASVVMLLRHGVPTALRLPMLAICLCLVVLAASAVFSAHPDIAVRFSLKYANSLLFLWVCLNFALASPYFARAATLAALGALWGNVLLGAGVRLGLSPLRDLSLAFHPESTYKYLPRVSGIYEHPSVFGATAVLAALLAFQVYWRGELSKHTMRLGVAGAFFALLLTEARNNLLPLLALGSAALWIKRNDLHATNRLRFAVGIGVVFMLLGFVLWRRHTELTSAISKENLLTAFTLGRTYIWKGAFEAWRTNPWFGLGAGVFQFLTPDFTGGRFDRGELHAHNVLLAILSETGLAGLSAYVFLITSLWAPLLKQSGFASNRLWALIWLAVLPCFGLFDFYLPFYGFSVHLALVIAYQYTSAYHRQDAHAIDATTLRPKQSKLTAF